MSKDIPEEGLVILIDKPKTWTSFGVVKKIRGKLGIKKVGHAGTLDPLATGLLILCAGKKTKQIEDIQSKTKEYSGTIVLGATTPSHDLETEIKKTLTDEEIMLISDEAIREAIDNSLIGTIQQIPPQHSAIKVNGKRAYKSARKGEVIVLKPREVSVYEFRINRINFNTIQFNIKCGKGTYIRSLARDLGDILKCGAYLSSLRRESIGEYCVEDAVSPEEFIN